MIAIRRASERGLTNWSWLKSFHTFSFGEYHDPLHMGFRSLRVLNDDWIAPGMGFGMHPHRDLEIITIVLEGELEHKDSLGTGSIIRPGEVQRMSAGSGILHSEHNASLADPVHLLQVWLLPEKRGLEPSYEQKSFPESELSGRLCLVAARDGRLGALTIHQDASIYLARLGPEQSVTHSLHSGRAAWIQVGSGRISLNGQALGEGDGAAIEQQPELNITAVNSAELVLLDLGPGH